MIVSTLEIDNHVRLSLVIADAPHKAAPGDRLTGEGFEIDWAAIFDVDRLGVRQTTYPQQSHQRKTQRLSRGRRAGAFQHLNLPKRFR